MIDNLALASHLSSVTAPFIGEEFLRISVNGLASLLGAQFAFITRALDFPTTRVQIVACTAPGVVDEFELTGTPCELVYKGQALSIHEGLAQTFAGSRNGGFESFIGFPLFNKEKRCIGHLGIFFKEPTVLSDSLNHQLSELALRQSAELQRLELSTQIECAQRKLDYQNRLLRYATQQEPLDFVLTQLIAGIEAEVPDLLCTIMLPDSDGQMLSIAAASQAFPPEYLFALNSVSIAPESGSCGSAAFRKERVIVSDIATHPLWKHHSKLALTHGLYSCWSQPITGRDQRLLGVFAIYQRHPGTPSAAEIERIESAADLGSLVLSHYQAISALHLKNRKYELFLRTAADGIVVIDLDGRFIEISDGFLRQVGATKRTQIENTRIWDWDVTNDEESCRALLASFVEHPVIFETTNRRINGEHWHAEVSASAFRVNDQTLIWASARDITERKRMEAELDRRATCDILTGLINRPSFLDTLAAEFQRSQRHGRHLSVLLLEVDYLKSINDNYGHEAGDRFLQQAAVACQLALRHEDSIGRLGDKEFGFILPETDEPGAIEVAEKIRHSFENHTFSSPSAATLVVVPRTCSIGCSTLAGSESSHEEFLAQASQARYQAKALGRNRVCSYNNVI